MALRPWILGGAAAGLAIAAACATSSPPGELYTSVQYEAAAAAIDAGADPEKMMICQETMVTGSHIPMRRCWSKAQMDRDRDSAQHRAENQNKVGVPDVASGKPPVPGGSH